MGQITIIDVAREAGVAISTVSVALNNRPGVSDETRSRIQKVAAEMGWVPSIRGRSLSSKRTFSIGMVISQSEEGQDADPFLWAFLAGVNAVLHERGYVLILETATSPADVQSRLTELVKARDIDGIILTDQLCDDPRIPLLRTLDVPTVVVGVPPCDVGLPAVLQHHETALRQIMRLILDSSHTRIAHVSGEPGFLYTDLRRDIWRDEMSAAGLTPQLEECGHFTFSGGFAAAATLMNASHPPTAVMCANDSSALGFMAGCRALGLSIPTDVSVTGFDDIEMARYAEPPLTTARASLRELGRMAAMLMMARLEGGDAANVHAPQAELVVRGSVAPPRNG